MKLSLNINSNRNKQKACTKVREEWLSELGHTGTIWIELVIFCDHSLTFKVKLGPYPCDLQCTGNLKVLPQIDNPLFIVNHMGLVLQSYVHVKQGKILFTNIFHSAGFSSNVSATMIQQPVCHMWKYLSYEYAEFLFKEDLFSRDFKFSMGKEVIMKIRRLFLNSGLIQML